MGTCWDGAGRENGDCEAMGDWPAVYCASGIGLRVIAGIGWLSLAEDSGYMPLGMVMRRSWGSFVGC